MPIPDFAKSNIRLKPIPAQAFCPRHMRWEVIVEDDSLCEWCCAAKPCDLHPDEHWSDGIESGGSLTRERVEEAFEFIELSDL